VSSFLEDETYPWNNVVLGNGTKGAIYGRDKCIRVTNTHDKMPTDEVWLYIREHIKSDGKIEHKYAFCNESADASADDVRKPALMRWSIEQCFHEGKTYLGMDHYQNEDLGRMASSYALHVYLPPVR
jgi:hypothetical protein